MIKISIILSFRERTWFLNKMLETLIETTSDLSQIELLMIMDDDDECITDLDISLPNVNVVLTERSIHFTKDYLNPLATLAKGRWIIVINDDSEFLTHHWDNLLLDQMQEASEKVGDDILLGMVDDQIKNNSFTSFPTLSKEMFDVLGYIMDEHCYMWGSDHILTSLFKYLDNSNRFVRMPNITIGHNSLHTGRRTYSENFKRFQYIHDNYPTNITSVHLRKEASKIKEYIK